MTTVVCPRCGALVPLKKAEKPARERAAYMRQWRARRRRDAEWRKSQALKAKP